jgi:hypothetical protein
VTFARQRAYQPVVEAKPNQVCFYLAPGSEITPRATSLFQMNSTTSAPMVAMMNPAP